MQTCSPQMHMPPTHAHMPWQLASFTNSLTGERQKVSGQLSTLDLRSSCVDNFRYEYFPWFSYEPRILCLFCFLPFKPPMHCHWSLHPGVTLRCLIALLLNLSLSPITPFQGFTASPTLSNSISMVICALATQSPVIIEDNNQSYIIQISKKKKTCRACFVYLYFIEV